MTLASQKLHRPKRSLKVYFGGPSFDVKHLVGNAYLAEAVYEKSHGRFLCQLPQDLALRTSSARAVRDQRIQNLLACDLALFNFDGADLDSGTTVEFMLAKFADIPTVILRTDSRAGGGAGAARRDPWSSMANFYPRTVSVLAASVPDYRELQKKQGRPLHDDVVRLAGQHASAAGAILCERLAAQIVRALERVRHLPPHMPRHLREEVYQWLALMPALRGKKKLLRKQLETHLERKVENDLL